ncbi:MAG: ABC transporter permease [Dehalococcoidia bacterium]|nr:ABC transporter permease [Dehalococcoidia bacterium]
MATDQSSILSAQEPESAIALGGRSRWRSLGTHAKQNPLATISAFILIVMCLTAIFAPYVTQYGPTDQVLTDRLQSPNGNHWLGTDNFGRDVFSRIVYGSRVSLFIGLSATAIGVAIGAVIGVIAGYLGGWVDLVSQRFIDALMAIPGLLLLMIVAMVLGAHTSSIIIALVIFIIAPSTRVVRGHAIQLSNEPYVEAARVVGASNWRILFRHILPNVFATVIVAASVIIGAVILAEAALGFLGLGVGEPTPTWGNMLSTSGQQYMEQAPWLAIAPGIVIMLVVGSLNLLGDGLRDVLDPRLRGR